MCIGAGKIFYEIVNELILVIIYEVMAPDIHKKLVSVANCVCLFVFFHLIQTEFM